MKTDFFTSLEQVLDGAGATMSITPKNGELTVSFLPRATNKTGPRELNMTGTPEEFNEEFFGKITEAVAIFKTAGLKTNLEEVKASAPAEPARKEKKAAAVTGPAPGTIPTPEQVEKVKKLKLQRKSVAFIADKSGLKEEQVKEILEGKAAPAKGPHPQAELEIPPAPEKVSHTGGDLSRFKDLLTVQMYDAQDAIMLAEKKKERTSDESVKADMLAAINTNRSIEENCKNKLEEIEAGTFGTRKDQTELIPVEELLTQLNPKN